MSTSDDRPTRPSSTGAQEWVIAIDPGSHKCGVAVVGRDGRIAERDVIPAGELNNHVHRLVGLWTPITIVIGRGTGSRGLIESLTASKPGAPIQPVDESHTSEAARARFVAENAPHGWQRLLPRSLRTPDRAYDDYVAVILAERFWQAQADR